MQDFKDRVRPLAKDVALMDVTRKYQKISIKDIMEEKQEQLDMFKKMEAQANTNEDSLEEGYSSKEIEEKKNQ